MIIILNNFINLDKIRHFQQITEKKTTYTTRWQREKLTMFVTMSSVMS